MERVPSFVCELRGLASTMTAPTHASWVTILAGWVLASRRTVTWTILVVGETAGKHFASYHRIVCSAARWSLDAMGLAVFDLIEPWLKGEAMPLALDVTLARIVTAIRSDVRGTRRKPPRRSPTCCEPSADSASDDTFIPTHHRPRFEELQQLLANTVALAT